MFLMCVCEMCLMDYHNMHSHINRKAGKIITCAKIKTKIYIMTELCKSEEKKKYYAIFSFSVNIKWRCLPC